MDYGEYCNGGFRSLVERRTKDGASLARIGLPVGVSYDESDEVDESDDTETVRDETGTLDVCRESVDP